MLGSSPLQCPLRLEHSVVKAGLDNDGMLLQAYLSKANQHYKEPAMLFLTAKTR